MSYYCPICDKIFFSKSSAAACSAAHPRTKYVFGTKEFAVDGWIVSCGKVFPVEKKNGGWLTEFGVIFGEGVEVFKSRKAAEYDLLSKAYQVQLETLVKDKELLAETVRKLQELEREEG